MMRKTLMIVLVSVFIALFIIGCQVQTLPPPPKAFGGPIGRATIFYPDWATAPNGKLSLSPANFSLGATDTATATLTATDDFVWNTLYVLSNANSWVPLTSTCSPVQNSQWCEDTGSASFTVDLSTFSYGHNFAIGYTCTDLGAGTFDCSGGRWKLLIFDIEQPSANEAPTVQITSPQTGVSYTEGATVEVVGSGTDPEDGPLPGTSLSWSSDLDGDLGTGNNLVTTALSRGTHTITLTGTDSDSATGTDSITINIIEYAPDPNACTENDGRDDPTQKGTTRKGNTSFTDYCAGTNLVEYYCENNEIQTKNYVPVAHEICRDGKFELRPKIMAVDQCYLGGNYDGVNYPSCPGQALIRNIRYFSYNTILGNDQGTNLWEMHNYGNDCVRKFTLCMHQGIPASVTNCQTESDSSEGPWKYPCDPPACPTGQNSLQGYVRTSHYAQPGSNTYRYMNRYNRICMGNGYTGTVISCEDSTEARTCTLDCPTGSVDVGIEITDPVIPHLYYLKAHDVKNRVFHFVHNKICVVATCADNLQNGDETDIDCGGPHCNKCAIGKQCNQNSDCFNNNCVGGVCRQNPTQIISRDSTVTPYALNPDQIPDPVCPVDTTASTTMYGFHGTSNSHGRKYRICSEPGITTDIRSCTVTNGPGAGPLNSTCEPPACDPNFTTLGGFFLTEYLEASTYKTTYYRICMSGVQEGRITRCADLSEGRTCSLNCNTGFPPVDTALYSIGEVTEPVYNSTVAPLMHNFWHQMVCIRK